MRICIYGAGAIGAYLGGVLTEAGCEVTLIARGPHLDAMRRNGLTLERDGQTLVKELEISLTGGETRELSIDFDNADKLAGTGSRATR